MNTLDSFEIRLKSLMNELSAQGYSTKCLDADGSTVSDAYNFIQAEIDKLRESYSDDLFQELEYHVRGFEELFENLIGCPYSEVGFNNIVSPRSLADMFLERSNNLDSNNLDLNGSSFSFAQSGRLGSFRYDPNSTESFERQFKFWFYGDYCPGDCATCRKNSACNNSTFLY